MKKTAAYVLGFSLIASQLSPALAKASETNVVDYKSNEEISKYLSEDLDYKVEKNVSENVDRIEAKIGEEYVVAIFDRENGTVTIDGEVVATIKETSDGSFDGSENKLLPGDISTYNFAGYPEYTIGTKNWGSGTWNINKNKTSVISFAKGATVVAITATLIAAFLDDKPSMKDAAIIAAAASLYALFAETLSFNVSFKGTTDKYDSYTHQDSIYVWKKTGGVSEGIFKIYFNYWTNT